MENKPFFTKYIAVEGEIKEGDKFIWLNEVFTATPLTMKMGQADRPVKLFLCSRDIQVGDYICTNPDSTCQSEFRFTGEPATECINCGAKLVKKEYKVIGEISPEATWVKEGDEFDEYRWIWEPGEDMETEYLTEEEKQKGRYEIKTWANQIAVKGPCGHWH